MGHDMTKMPMATYPVIALTILERLFTGKKRSSDLTDSIGFSPKLVYQTIFELIEADLMKIETDRPKFKVYELTDKGHAMVNDAIIKSNDKLVDIILSSPKKYEILLAAVTELMCRDLEAPTKESMKPLIKGIIKEKFLEIEQKRQKILEITAT